MQGRTHQQFTRDHGFNEKATRGLGSNVFLITFKRKTLFIPEFFFSKCLNGKALQTCSPRTTGRNSEHRSFLSDSEDIM